MEEGKDKISMAFIEFQKEMPEVKLDSTVKVKTKTGGEYKFKYATLANILKKVLPILALKGLGITQTFSEETLITTLVHESGQTWNSAIGIDLHSGTMQEVGSRISYLKRYGISAMLGIVAEEDDDANIASGNNYQHETKPPPTEPQAKTTPASQEGLTIKDIRLKTGLKKDGSKWEKYTIIDSNNVSYITFSKSDAMVAKKAKEKGLIVKIESEDNEYKGKDLVKIEAIETTAPPENISESIEIYKDMFRTMDMEGLLEWDKKNQEELDRIKKADPAAFISLMTVYDKRVVEERENEDVPI